LLGAAALVLALSGAALAQQSYKTPDEAAEALASAARSGDRKALLTVLGQGGADIVQSGDAVADSATRERFVAAYDAKHQVETGEENKATLVVGQDDFPFPIPLVRKDGGWQFDTAAGREEILYRRIGRNELAAMQAALAYVDAQQDYAEKGVSGPGIYARRIVSQPGKKDGLYWPAKSGEDESPLGKFAAEAAADGYRAGQTPKPYHGYFYRILTRQGANASGGATDYVVRGKMIGGFALVAYPAQYGNSGVMTFVVNHEGVVYEKDLGPRTPSIAARMAAFNPDGTWRRVSEADLKADAAR
jgi:hypothetical protein